MIASAVAALLLLGTSARAQDHAHGHADVAIRIDQALLETPAVLAAQRQALDATISDFALELRDDGLHASGNYRIAILPDVHFEAVASFVWIKPNVFELRVRKTRVVFFNVTQKVLDAIEGVLKESLPSVCAFQPLGEQPDGSQASRVAVDMKALMPGLPTLALSGITSRDKILILKARLP